MKKLLSKFSLFITFFIVFGLSYIIKLIGISTQGTAFIYLIGILIFCVTIKIFIGVTINEYKSSKLLVIAFMIPMYCTILLVSWLAIKLLNVNLETAFQLITFGIVLQPIMKERQLHETEK
jgi:hypothetical protein